MQIRWPIAVLALFVSLLVLFGGYFGFQWLQVEKPIRDTVQQTAHVKLEKMQVTPDRITIQLRPDAKFSLVSDYISLREAIQIHGGNRKLEIRFSDRPDPTLNHAWNRMVFGVREGMARGRFTMIPKTVKQVAEGEGIQYRLGMDKKFVYVELHRGDHYLYQVLPLRQPEREVKDHG
ncbi:hypothetical protein [Kroppenstedtia eburnea]|uniref:Uncharacterized protein n=1 Tax=Kroppenstedtia eburnea TaxID=714067 RepID=A0A1N7IQY3_9BACL|nr:hypothetical protein [Kroppenstedtia eburnea]QKI82103.1 hypothetical protein GXN75_08855 [Kroppenstedtia eburnea]SIS39488.1 hypothetical protein SAMN05421790_101253 [Kroppenstedtia eburnea]